MKKLVISAALCTFALFAGAAHAGPKPVVLTIAPSVDDVTLVLQAADMYEYLGKVNPQGVQSSTPIAAEFGGTWNPIGAFGSTGAAVSANGLIASPLSFTFSLNPGNKSGSWSVTNTLQDTDVKLDLVFAMHSGSVSGAWLFDEHTFLAGTTQNGEWIQRLLNNGGNAGQFSNLTLFARDMVLTLVPPPPVDPIPTPTDVPEPATLGTLVLGLGMAGYMSRRRRKQS